MGNGRSSSDTSVSSSHSFLSSKKSDVKTKSEIIVVKKRTNTIDSSSPKNDDTMKRFLEIPKFFPILKSSLNQSGLRDQPEAIFRISARPVLKFAHRLREHLSHCANVVVVEQESLGNSIKDIDRDIALLLVQLSDRKKSIDRFRNQLEQISDLQTHISNLQFLFRDLIPMTMTLNEILPEQKRLPVINIDCLVNAVEYPSDEKSSEIMQEIESDTYAANNYKDTLHIEPIDEVVVVDKNNA